MSPQYDTDTLPKYLSIYTTVHEDIPSSLYLSLIQKMCNLLLSMREHLIYIKENKLRGKQHHNSQTENCDIWVTILISLCIKFWNMVKLHIHTKEMLYYSTSYQGGNIMYSWSYQLQTCQHVILSFRRFLKYFIFNVKCRKIFKHMI